MPKDYYCILGINPDADLRRIKRAYRERAKKHHPDVADAGESSQKFIELQEAYQVLSDAERRRRYDREAEQREKTGPYPPRPKRRRHAPVHPKHREEPRFFRSPVVDPGDVFLEIVLRRHEAMQGGEFPISFPASAVCPRCKGTGLQWDFLLCPVCAGRGTVRLQHRLTLQLPPGIAHGTEARLSLAQAGLPGIHLRLRVRVEPELEPYFR